MPGQRRERRRRTCRTEESAALGKLIAGILDRATFNVLTDEGLLPNYAFPEQGVLLHSVILRNRKTGAAGDAGGEALALIDLGV